MGNIKKDEIENQTLILKGRCVIQGLKKGIALVCERALSAAGGIDPKTGIIIESRHPQRGETIKKKILVFPNGKGSSGFSLIFHALSLFGNAPKAMVIDKLNSLAALAAVVGNIPTVCGPFDMDKKATEVIKTGDKIIVDATKGLIFRVNE